MRYSGFLGLFLTHPECGRPDHVCKMPLGAAPCVRLAVGKTSLALEFPACVCTCKHISEPSLDPSCTYVSMTAMLYAFATGDINARKRLALSTTAIESGELSWFGLLFFANTGPTLNAN